MVFVLYPLQVSVAPYLVILSGATVDGHAHHKARAVENDRASNFEIMNFLFNKLLINYPINKLGIGVQQPSINLIMRGAWPQLPDGHGLVLPQDAHRDAQELLRLCKRIQNQHRLRELNVATKMILNN